MILYDPVHAPDVLTSTKVNVNVPSQLSEAVAIAKTGLAEQSMVVRPGKASITGATKSSFQIIVRVTGIAELPHASVILNVRVCDFRHESPVTGLSLEVGVLTEQLSVAVAVPNAASISFTDGLHPSVNVVPVAVITGNSVSVDQVTVRLTSIAALPHASVTLNILVWY